MIPGNKSESIAEHLKTLELALLDPALRRDPARVAALLAEDFQEFGSSGRVWARQQILNLLATEDYSPPAVEDLDCHLLGEDVALVTYKTVRTSGDGARSEVLRSSLWTRKGVEWRVRFHQGTRAL